MMFQPLPRSAARPLAILFAIAPAALLAGCGQSDPSPSGAPSAGESVPAPEPAADLVIYAHIRTGDDARPEAEAVAARADRIVYVGDRAGAAALISPATDVVDLKDGALYPGFVDSHAHLLGIGMRELTLNLEGTPSVAALVERVAAEVAKAEPGDVVSGRGWIETGWPEKRFPTRDDLDPVSPDNPVILQRADGHALLANSAALAAAGVDETTADPEGGRIEHDADGRPTGILVDAAQALVSNLIAAPSEARKEEAYRVGAKVEAAYGLTGVHYMSVDPADVPLLERMSQDGEIPIRVYNALNANTYGKDDFAMPDALEGALPRTSPNGRIVTRGVKLYMDGALGSRGAALLAPYSDRPDISGLLLMHHDAAVPFLEEALRKGVQVDTHAIGDRGNRTILDWYEEAFDAVPPEERAVANPRWRVEHAQILSPVDIPRFAQLGVIPSMQPSHAIGDFFFAPDRLGTDRLKGAYAWKSLIDTGAIVPAGSDAPVERGDPRIEFYAAVARKSLKGYSDENWHPEEAVDRETALKMFTAWPAYASFAEDDLGKITVGRKADFTAFDRDLLTVPEADILTATPLLTVVDGAIVYRAAP